MADSAIDNQGGAHSRKTGSFRRPSLLVGSVMVLEAFGQLIDVVWRPSRHLHAEMEAHLGQHLLDLVERLSPEIRGAQHLGFALLNQIADVDDIVVLETIGRAYGKLELVDLLEKSGIEGQIRDRLHHA